ncbi:MAG: hypothetical protein PHG65_08175, partial [Kiritimatiellae bacterium]|nr:hypothetical protein [Kiritimatiellia bacterium]
REKHALFQAGRLYLDARVCELCLEVLDAARHAALAGLSGACLVYCEIRRPGVPAKNIVAVITDGDSNGLMVGRNGIFYDRKGRCWDATITRIAANPISLREAFWMPYKKLLRFIEEQVAKRALAAEQASQDKMASAATNVAAVGEKPVAPSVQPKKIDLGTIALIGAAVGGMSALVGGFMVAFFGLGLWIPVGIVGIILLISGPSMVLAWLKLRSRNMGPILDANGWAINTRALVNAPFGASMTRLAELPPHSTRARPDPFAARKTSWAQVLILLILLILLALRLAGPFNRFVPECLRCSSPAERTTQP